VQKAVGVQEGREFLEVETAVFVHVELIDVRRDEDGAERRTTQREASIQGHVDWDADIGDPSRNSHVKAAKQGLVERPRIGKSRFAPYASEHLGGGVDIAAAVADQRMLLDVGEAVLDAHGEVAKFTFGAIVDEGDIKISGDPGQRELARFLAAFLVFFGVLLRRDISISPVVWR
jgi:hypothetical protein